MSMANTIFSVGSDGLPTYIRNMPTAVPGTSIEYQRYEAPSSAEEVQEGLKSQLVRGTLTFSKDRLKELDPSYTGYTQIFVLRMPEFMKAVKDGYVIDGFAGDSQVQVAKYHYNNLKAMLELASTSYQGTPELTLNTADINVGWSEKNYAVATYSAYDSTSFTIRVLETRRAISSVSKIIKLSSSASDNERLSRINKRMLSVTSALSI